jgi:phospholipase C
MNRLLRLLCSVALLGSVLPVLALPPATAQATSRDAVTKTPIKHFLFLLQGDRSFDNYFGTYPGADGLANATCQQQAPGKSGGCIKPLSLHGETVPPLGATPAVIEKQYDGGKMDHFVSAMQAVGLDGIKAMGYYDQRDLPAYWRAASEYVLFDRFFSATRAGVQSNRQYWVAGTDTTASGNSQPLTIFDRLQAAGISWKFYVQNYRPAAGSSPSGKPSTAGKASKPATTGRPSTATGGSSRGASNTQAAAVPLLNFPRFTTNPALSSHIVDLGQYYQDLQDGTLPAVAYIATSGASERSSRSISEGQSLVTSLTGQLMLSRFWSSSAFLLSYDGTGGFYDHVAPPQRDAYGLGLRVPALLISSYAKRGAIVPDVLDYTSALAFIEHNWSVAPLASRDRQAGSLLPAFDFTAPARPPQLITGASPAAPPGKLRSTGIVYLAYGSSLALVLATVGFALVRGRIRRPAHLPATTHESISAQRIGAESR